jgi:hypothetical protein
MNRGIDIKGGVSREVSAGFGIICSRRSFCRVTRRSARVIIAAATWLWPSGRWLFISLCVFIVSGR